MASTSAADLTPDTRQLAEKLIAAAAAQGIKTEMSSTHRSCAEQGPGGMTATVLGQPAHRAAYCRSWHVWGRAFDIFPVGVTTSSPSDPRWAVLGAIGESLGLVWGGKFNPPATEPWHFEYHPGMDLKSLCPDSAVASAVACEAAVAAGNAKQPPAPGPPPAPPESNLAGQVLAFAAGAAAGWWVAQRWRKQ